ncbi:PadR family transcriptional regulator [Streptomyces sp. NPDC048248]|uniref:PadR family transcriptional regulator n=1 Tax=Streptomyces sp. NPDC048248 TaxID=3365523 RepID=UPI00371A2E3C
MTMQVTPTVARLLRVFLEDPQAEHYGMQLMKQASLSSGSLYPILARLEKAEWIAGKTEDIDPQKEGRPARRYYTITGEGVRAARQELAELSEQFRLPKATPGPMPGVQPKGT